MKIIQRENIDLQRWDMLVSSGINSNVFSLSAYLDAVSENWCILTNEDYSCGMAFPFTKRFGIKTCYTPIFVRSLEWFGENTISEKVLVEQLMKEFPAGNLNTSRLLGNLKKEDFIYQKISHSSAYNLNSQAKRMLTKFEKSGMTIDFQSTTEEVMEHIYAELPQKVKALNNQSLANLKKLVKALRKNGFLKVITVKKIEKIVGGIFLIELNNTVLYLKGAFTSDSKKDGAMYATMQKAIGYAREKEMDFDFGGSRVDGVRRFNVNLGGVDQDYFSYSWDNSPIWFKGLKRIKKAWKKK